MRRILDAFGREIPETPAGDDLSRRTIVDRVSDRQSTDSILCDVTPSRIAHAFREADDGFPAAQMELAETIEERDAHCASCLQTRLAAAVEVEWQIEPGDDSSESQLAAEAFSEAWDALDTESIKTRLLSAILPQWSVERVIWETNGKVRGRREWRPIHCEQVDRRRLMWPAVGFATEAGDITPIVPLISRDFTTTNTEPLEPGRYLAHNYKAMRGRPGRMALVRTVAVLWMLKRGSYVALGEFCDRYGLPMAAVKYDPAQKTPAEVRDAIAAVAAAARGGAFGIPKGSELELVQAIAAGTVPHEVMIRLCDEAMSKVLVGSTTIADAANTGASQSVSSPTHADVRLKLRNADCRALAATIRRDLAVPFVLWNFGPGVAAPKVSPSLDEKPQPAQRATIFTAAKTLGLACVTDQVYREMGLEKPDGVPNVLFAAVGDAEIARADKPPVAPGDAETARAGKPPVAPGAVAEITQPLNGAQIAAAIDVLVKVREEKLAPAAGVELLAGIGVERARAESIIKATPIGLDNSAGDAEFSRQLLLLLANVTGVGQAIYNGVDMEDLVAKTGIAGEKDYEFPYMPVRDGAGTLVSGDVIKDPAGDIVGGAPIAGTAPQQAGAPQNGGYRPSPGASGPDLSLPGRGAGAAAPDDVRVDEGTKGDADDTRTSVNSAGGTPPAIPGVAGAAEAATQLAVERMGRVRAFVGELISGGATPAEIRDRLPEILARMESGDMVELNAQALLAAILAGRARTVTEVRATT